MTKAELIAALATLPDDAEVLINAVATSNDFDYMCKQAKTDQEGAQSSVELSEITEIRIFSAEEASPAFGSIDHHLGYWRP